MIPSAAKHCGGRASQFIKYVNSFFRDNKLKSFQKPCTQIPAIFNVFFSHLLESTSSKPSLHEHWYPLTVSLHIWSHGDSNKHSS